MNALLIPEVANHIGQVLLGCGPIAYGRWRITCKKVYRIVAHYLHSVRETHLLVCQYIDPNRVRNILLDHCDWYIITCLPHGVTEHIEDHAIMVIREDIFIYCLADPSSIYCEYDVYEIAESLDPGIAGFDQLLCANSVYNNVLSARCCNMYVSGRIVDREPKLEILLTTPYNNNIHLTNDGYLLKYIALTTEWGAHYTCDIEIIRSVYLEHFDWLLFTRRII